MNSLRIISLLAIASCALSAAAQSAAVSNLSGGSNFPSFNGTNQTIGWAFTVNQAFSVSALGFMDSTPATPLGQSHKVGLWAGDGTLVASTTVGVSDPITGGFRYSALSSAATLAAGGTYRIGAAITSPFSDTYNIPASLTVDPMLTLTGSARNGSSGGFSDPTTVTAGNGRFGPNMLINPVPEPASMAALGIGAVAMLRRRKKA